MIGTLKYKTELFTGPTVAPSALKNDSPHFSHNRCYNASKYKASTTQVIRQCCDVKRTLYPGRVMVSNRDVRF